MHINFYSTAHFCGAFKKIKIKRRNVSKTMSWRIHLLTVAENGDKILFYG